MSREMLFNQMSNRFMQEVIELIMVDNLKKIHKVLIIIFFFIINIH